MSTRENIDIAKAILEQLGGSRFSAMTGAKNFASGVRSLQFSLPRAQKNGANKVRIKLTRDDLYTVEFWFLRGAHLSRVSVHDMVYADQLRALFTRETGLDTSL